MRKLLVALLMPLTVLIPASSLKAGPFNDAGISCTGQYRAGVDCSMAEISNGVIYHSWWTAQSGWNIENMNGTSDGTHLTAICKGASNSLMIFTEGTDSQIYYNQYFNGWTGWTPLGNIVATAQSITCDLDGTTEEVFVVGRGGVIYENYNPGLFWNGWVQPPF